MSGKPQTSLERLLAHIDERDFSWTAVRRRRDSRTMGLTFIGDFGAPTKRARADTTPPRLTFLVTGSSVGRCVPHTPSPERAERQSTFRDQRRQRPSTQKPEDTTRKPESSRRALGGLVVRVAQLTLNLLSYHEPPRYTRSVMTKPESFRAPSGFSRPSAAL